jgi:hypothetical protein
MADSGVRRFAMVAVPARTIGLAYTAEGQMSEVVALFLAAEDRRGSTNT